MREAFKKAAQRNTTILYQSLGEFIDGTWALAQKSTDVIDTFRAEIPCEGKELDTTLMLRNTISDLCSCLDALERGGDRTLQNNLRMAFEDFCLAVQLHWDTKAYDLFLKEKLSVPDAVPFAKKHKEGCQDFGRMYGLFSKISHHSRLLLLARQILFIDAKRNLICLAHLRPVNPAKLIPQVTNLTLIAFLLIEIGVLTEEMCHLIVDKPLYFGMKTSQGYEKRFDTPEAIFIMKLAGKLDPCSSFF